jgi:hypothetical protein
LRDIKIFWLVNRQFLIDAKNSSKIFILQVSAASAKAGSNFWKEINWLLDHGYKLITENGVEKLVPK